MTTTSPRPWKTGRSPGVDGRTIYTPDDNPRGGRLIGVMDTGDDARFVVEAVEAFDHLLENLTVAYEIGRQDQLNGADYRAEHQLVAAIGMERLLPSRSQVLEQVAGDLRKGFQESERRRKIAAVVAGYHQECLAGHGAEADTEAVIEAFNAVLAALGGKTDPVALGVADSPLVIEQVGSILTGQDGGADA